LLAASASADPRVSIDKMYRVGDVDKEFFCDECLTFASEALSALLQIILDGGVMGTCSALCSYVPEFEQICDIACDILGIEAFIKVGLSALCPSLLSFPVSLSLSLSLCVCLALCLFVCVCVGGCVCVYVSSGEITCSLVFRARSLADHPTTVSFPGPIPVLTIAVDHLP
jgi:hypothetical protein